LEAAKSRLGLPQLIGGKERGGRLQASGGGLHGLKFERALFGGCLFLSFEVPTNANAVEAALDAEGINAVAVFEPADGKQWVGHALVAASTGQPSFEFPLLRGEGIAPQGGDSR